MAEFLYAGLQEPPDVAKFSDVGFDFVKRSADIGPLFQNFALQQYIILCSQVIFYESILVWYSLDMVFFLFF